MIKNGAVYGDGKIICIFDYGIEWSVSLDCEKYLSTKISDIRKAKREEFLKSKEVKDLIGFCNEPRTIVEMMEYSNLYKSKSSFIKFIVEPLMKKRKFERKIDENCKVRQYLYYSTK